MTNINPGLPNIPVPQPAPAKADTSPPAQQKQLPPAQQQQVPPLEAASSAALPVIQNVSKDVADQQYLTTPIAQGGIKEQALPKGKGGNDAVAFLQNADNKKHNFVVYYSSSLKSWAVMFRDLMSAGPIALNDPSNPKATIKDQIPRIHKQKAEAQYQAAIGAVNRGQLPFGDVIAPPRRMVGSQKEAEYKLPTSKEKFLMWRQGNDLFVMFKEQNGYPYQLKKGEPPLEQIAYLPYSAEYAANDKKMQSELLSMDDTAGKDGSEG